MRGVDDLTTILLIVLWVYAASVAVYMLWLSSSVRAVERQVRAGASDPEHTQRLVRGTFFALIVIVGVQLALVPVTVLVESREMGWVILCAALALSFLATLWIDSARRRLTTGSGR